MIELVGRLLAPEDEGLRLVTVDDGVVTSISDASEAGPDALGGRDAWTVPGLLDIQLNGAFGIDFSDSAADLSAAAASLPATGVTAFLPTVISSPVAAYRPILANLARSLPPDGARVLGTHVEGPFLSPDRRGTHDPDALRSPDLAEARAWLDVGDVRIVTLAPELPGADEVIRELVARGVVVAIGHSDATWDQADAAVAAGARLGTHLFNAMRSLHHRQPGIAGRLLGPGVAVSVVVDGVHVAPQMIRLVAGIKLPDELIFVTDGVPALGQPPGTYRMASLEVISDGTVARLADGTISGSVVPMAIALGRLVRGGLDPVAAVRAASTTPARLLGLEAEFGRIAVGRVADLVLLDASWRPVLTIVQGRVAHGAGASAGGSS